MRRVSNASSPEGNAACPVCSHALTSARVVKSPKATASALFGTIARRRFGAGRSHNHHLLKNGDKAMRQQLGNGFGRHEDISVRIGEISTSGIRAASRTVIVQLDNAHGNRGPAGRRKQKSTGGSQRENSLHRHLYQTLIIDQKSRC